MPLPLIATPTYELTLPSNGETVKFRPFLVKEEKILLMALQGQDEKEMLEAIKQTVQACAVSKINADVLPTFDLEWFFLKLRAKSVNEVVDLAYRCRNKVTKELNGAPTEATCGNVVKYQVKIEDIKIKTDPAHSKQIKLSDTLGINMKYPTFQLAKKMTGRPEGKEDVNETLEAVAACVESVWDADNIYDQFTAKEIVAFLESMTQSQFRLIQGFLETMPKLEHDFTFTCGKCGYSDTVHLEGLASFFG